MLHGQSIKEIAPRHVRMDMSEEKEEEYQDAGQEGARVSMTPSLC